MEKHPRPGVTRRTMMGAGAATIAVAAASDLLNLDLLFGATRGARSGIGYFSRFGVTEALIRETLNAALSKSGEYADVFFQHRLSNYMMLEDGSVNRAYANVALGVGVRVVNGTQTGYGFTEEITPAALKRAALTAAALTAFVTHPFK